MSYYTNIDNIKQIFNIPASSLSLEQRLVKDFKRKKKTSCPRTQKKRKFKRRTFRNN